MIRTSFLSILLLVVISFICVSPLQAQSLRYFEFRVMVDSPWQDTSFVAATADTAVIDSVLADLSRPLAERRLIDGHIAGGDAGCNHNGGHWFLWHFMPGQWALGDVAIEVCDGRPYSDVDVDTTYWIHTLGQYCPWAAKSLREVPAPLAVSQPSISLDITIGPDPVTDRLTVFNNGTRNLRLDIYNSIGQQALTASVTDPQATLDVSGLAPGVYLLHMSSGLENLIKKFVVVR